MNNSEALTTLIVGGITAKEYSQRELARRVGISNSSLNDIENGKVAKPDSEILKRIAAELDLFFATAFKSSWL
jgi:transcriptional regulator with XRE-family HTH domain